MKDYYLTAYCSARKRWFTWHGWLMEELKPLVKAEGLIKLKKVQKIKTRGK